MLRDVATSALQNQPRLGEDEGTMRESTNRDRYRPRRARGISDLINTRPGERELKGRRTYASDYTDGVLRF